MCKKLSTAALLALLLPSLAILAACGGGNDGLLDNDDCDYLMAVGISDGGTVQIVTDRQCPSYLALDLTCGIEFRAPGDPGGTTSAQFYIAYYDVTYRNNRTGGTTPGIDVPAPIRVPLASVTDPGEEVEFQGWPILEPGQKLNAPLNDEAFYPPGGVPMTATLTWWGWPLTNPDAVCFQTMSWEFTVYSSGALPDDPDALEVFLASCN